MAFIFLDIEAPMDLPGVHLRRRTQRASVVISIVHRKMSGEMT